MAGTIPQEIQRIEDEVATQAAKIAQLSTILDGKAAGGGGGVETCSVTINESFSIVYISATCLVDGQMSTENLEMSNVPATIQNVVVGTGIYCIVLGEYENTVVYSSDGDIVLDYIFANGISPTSKPGVVAVFRATSTNGGTIYIE